jgi:hypothetical protein
MREDHTPSPMSDTASKSTHTHTHTPETEAPLDVRERGAMIDGQAQWLDRRLFMQLLAFECEGDPTAVVQSLGASLRDAGAPSVIYNDVNNPRGFAVLAWSENPEHFVTVVRPRLVIPGVRSRPELSMLGRSYSTGYESDLAFWLIDRPKKTCLNEAWPWAVWYPLRRIGAFNRLDGREQGGILREHGTIGKRYGEADLAHDVRLACHGLDANDNEFIIGLIGRELHPLSHVVQSMRKTRQTAEFMDSMGPFFVGHVAWRNDV